MERAHPVFGTDKFGSDRKLENRFVLPRENGRGRERFWADRVLLLFRLVGKHIAIKSEEDLGFVQYA